MDEHVERTFDPLGQKAGGSPPYFHLTHWSEVGTAYATGCRVQVVSEKDEIEIL